MSTRVYKASGKRAVRKTAVRPRNAVATREAILQSALAAFTRAGYEGVGVREIAKDAGVTAMLVNRYFGSKEALFEAAVEVAFSDGSLLSGGVGALGLDTARSMLAKTDPDACPIDPLMLMLRSAPNPRAAAILREHIEKHFEKPLAALLPGADPDVRAALYLSAIAGFQLMRKVIGSTALRDADGPALAARLAALFESLTAPTGGVKGPPSR